MIADKEQIKWCKEKWGTNEEPEETPIERPHYDNDSLKNLDKKFNENFTHNKNQIIIDGCNVSNCKYYMENNGVEHQGLYQYTNMCYKQPYDNCENKPFCWHKLVTRIRRMLKYDR